jgi:hypothetical protein
MVQSHVMTLVEVEHLRSSWPRRPQATALKEDRRIIAVSAFQ